MAANNEMIESSKKISMRMWEKRLRAFLKYGIASQKALVCEGEAGCGKSEITAQVCRDLGLEPVICPGLGGQQMEEFLALTRLDVDENGAGKVVQGVLDTIIPTWDLVEKGNHVIELEDGTKKVVIPWLIDEIFTGNMGQANQLRAALTFRKIGSVELPAGEYNGMPVGVYIIGTTNPEDVVYSSRRSVDSAVMERISSYKVFMEFDHHQSYLTKLERGGLYPEVCRLFLRMDEQRDLWNMASPRFWTQGFGQSWMELSSDKSISDSDKLTLFLAELTSQMHTLEFRKTQRGKKGGESLAPTAIIARFKNFIMHGDDPKYYPISSNRILYGAGDSAEEKRIINLLKYWQEKKQHGFIGITMQDLSSALRTLDSDGITSDQAEHIADIMEVVGSGYAASLMYDVVTVEKVMTQLEFAILNRDFYESLHEAMCTSHNIKADVMDMGKEHRQAG